nr:immunoglobulin heavy chain junction region [Mus musculus]
CARSHYDYTWFAYW